MTVIQSGLITRNAGHEKFLKEGIILHIQSIKDITYHLKTILSVDVAKTVGCKAEDVYKYFIYLGLVICFEYLRFLVRCQEID